MVETISSQERTARKDHEDSAGVWIENSLSDIRSCGELTFGELRSIAKLKANGWKILKGERAKLRSKTFDGIANAMAVQWSSYACR